MSEASPDGEVGKLNFTLRRRSKTSLHSNFTFAQAKTSLKEKERTALAEAFSLFVFLFLYTELDAWDAYELDELPLIKDFVQDFKPSNPFDEGWTLTVEFVDPND